MQHLNSQYMGQNNLFFLFFIHASYLSLNISLLFPSFHCLLYFHDLAVEEASFKYGELQLARFNSQPRCQTVCPLNLSPYCIHCIMY